jgi:L-aspartate oxidase
VQFHPTALRCVLDPLPLLTEALRGAGAKLVRDDGLRFMAQVDQRTELAPRDIVARAVWQQQQAGHTVLLDATEVFASEHAAEFPSARAACMAQGIDPARTAIPITSAAHFHMGGVITDAQGHSNLPGLWACGEVAYTGLHGANRLASNSLLEAVVVGCATGRALAKQRYVHRDYQQNTRATPAPVDTQRPEWQQLRLLMWATMGPVRTAAELRLALQHLQTLQRNLDPTDITLLQRMSLAAVMVRAALNREESRGAHWRSDFPQRNHQLDGRYALVAMPSTSIANSLFNPAGTQ